MGSALIAAGALAGSAVAEVAAPRATTVVDRTLVCTTGVQGGARVIHVRGQAAFRPSAGDELEWLAQASVSAVGQPIPSKPNYRPTLAGVTAGWPPPRPLVAGGLGLDDRLCAPTRSRVALTSRRLTGGEVGALGDEYRCVVPKRFLMRVHVAFRAPVELTRRQRFVSAHGRIVRGRIAVATTSGAPLAYLEVVEAGRVRLFTSKACS